MQFLYLSWLFLTYLVFFSKSYCVRFFLNNFNVVEFITTTPIKNHIGGLEHGKIVAIEVELLFVPKRTNNQLTPANGAH